MEINAVGRYKSPHCVDTESMSPSNGFDPVTLVLQSKPGSFPWIEEMPSR